MPLNIISYKKAIWKGIEGHLKGIVQKLEDSRLILIQLNIKSVRVRERIIQGYSYLIFWLENLQGIFSQKHRKGKREMACTSNLYYTTF